MIAANYNVQLLLMDLGTIDVLSHRIVYTGRGFYLAG